MVMRRAETIIAKPADEVWARIRDFGDVSWIPGVASCTLDGDVRTIMMQGLDFPIVQQMLHRDDAARSYSYGFLGELDMEPIFGPGHIVRDFEATLTVTPEGPGSSRVTYDVDTAEFLVDGVHAEYQGSVDNLKAELEG
jgi:carbon monoxide dehydrogenase subunit G